MAGSKRLYKIELHKNSLLTQTCPEVELLMKEMKDGVSRENMLKRDWNRGAGIGIGIAPRLVKLVASPASQQVPAQTFHHFYKATK